MNKHKIATEKHIYLYHDHIHHKGLVIISQSYIYYKSVVLHTTVST